MLEIEMKFPLTDGAAFDRSLQQWHAIPGEVRTDADRYLNAPERDFAQTDEALRIRSIGARNFVTYKGPKTDPLTKTRIEIEVPLGDGPENADKFQTLLEKLGYRFVLLVQKQRWLYHLEQGPFTLEICRDHVAGLGDYVELEILAPAEQLEQARAVLLEVAARLGLSQSERRSYLEMLLTQR